MSAVGIYNANNYPDRTFDDSLEPVIFPCSQRLCNCHLSDNEWPVIMAEGVRPPYKYSTYLFCQSTSKTNPAEGRKLLKRMMNSRMSGRYILLEFQRLRGSRCVCVILYQITKLVMSSQISQEFQPLPEKLWFRVDVEYGASTSILLEGIIGGHYWNAQMLYSLLEPITWFRACPRVAHCHPLRNHERNLKGGKQSGRFLE